MGNEHKVLTRPAWLLALLGLVLVGAGAALWHQHQHDQAQTAAADQARRLANSLAGELGQRVNRHREQLEQLAGRPDSPVPTSDQPLAPTPWRDDTRQLRVPDGHPGEERLSFTLRELLHNLRERGEVVISSKGGEQPALLMARTTPGGAVILEHDLRPWLDSLDQRLPQGSALTLSHGDLTLIRRGRTGGASATASARGGPFNLTLVVPPTPPSWQSLLLPAGISAALVLLAIYAVFARLARRRPASTPAAGRRVDTATTPPRAVTPPVSSPPPAPEPEPEPEPEEQAGPEPGPAPPQALFGPDGIRATGDAPLDGTALEQLGRAIGSEAGAAGQHTLFVVCTGEADAKAALIDGLMASGRQVVDLGEAPPAVLHYATEVLESQSGVCLTGDGDQRALDVVINSELLHGDRLLTLRDRLLARNLDEGSGEREQRDINDRYLNAVADDIILARPMSVAVQGTGATAGLAPRLLGELGCKVVAVEGTDVDALARTVGEQNLNLGLAFDAGGGLSLVASDGRLIAADRLLMLLARDLLERNPGADVLFNMTDNQALAGLIRQQGGRPVMDDGGPARLRARMKELAVPLAGEANGHIFFADRWYGFSDALYAAARLLEVLSLQAGNSAEAFAPYTDTF
jgi:phosphomannomutase / phosphoglucomutase